MRRQQHVGSNKNNLWNLNTFLGTTTHYPAGVQIPGYNPSYKEQKSIEYSSEQQQKSQIIPRYTPPPSTPLACGVGNRILSPLGSQNYFERLFMGQVFDPSRPRSIPKLLNFNPLLPTSYATTPKPQQQVLTPPNSSKLSVDSTVNKQEGSDQNFNASTPTTVHPKDLNVNYTPAINNVIPKTAQKQVISTASQDNEKAEREAREKAEREAREKAEREAREKAEREAREKAEREAREKAEREAREKAEREAREKAEREAREKAEREAREKAEREAREKAEREAREKAEREAREKDEREAKEQEELQSQTNSIDAPGSTTLTTVNTSAANNPQGYPEFNKSDGEPDALVTEVKKEESSIPEEEGKKEEPEILVDLEEKINDSKDGNTQTEVLIEQPAPSDEQVDNVIKELPQDQIAQIVEKAKALELKVLDNLKTLYTGLKEELKNPPQKSDNSYLNKRLLIIKNIDNILKDIEKSEKNIGLGISINRRKALVTENLFRPQRELDSIKKDRQWRSEELKKLSALPDNQQINYSESELGKIEKFVQKSGKDLKQVANTRNDDIRRKFFSSFIDHTISFAKYNVNWAPAAYNLAWAVAEYVIMGIVVDTIKQGASSIKKSYGIGTGISNWIKGAPDKDDKEKTANLFTRSIATLSGIIGGGAAMTIMTPIILVFTGGKDVLYTPVGIYKNYQSYKKDKDGSTKNWAKSRAILKSERTTRKNEAHTTKEQKKFAETVKSQTTYEPKKR